MKKIVLTLTGISLLLFVSGCAKTEISDTRLYDYKPTSSAEKEVYDFFVGCEKAIDDKNLNKYLACYNDGAKVKITKGEGDEPMVTKAGYRNHLKGGAFKQMQSNKLMNPKIFVYGEKANIKCSKKHGSESVQMYDFNLVKDSGKWSIIRSDFKWAKK